MNSDRDSKLFDNISHTTSKISELIDRVRGYREEEPNEDLEMDNGSRWDNLKSRLSNNGEFQPAEDSEIENIEEKLGQQLNRDEEDN